MDKAHLPGQPGKSTSGPKKTQWHPPFCASMRLEFNKYKAILDYYMEYALNTKPLLIDLLVIRKASGIQIENEIGRIFKEYNIFEYKSPDDGLSIDDFFKTICYALLYKSDGEAVDAIDSLDVTVTFVRARKPVKLLDILRDKYGLLIKERAAGIYEVKEAYLGCVQIVVTRELNPKEHIWLTSLDDQMKKEDVRTLITEAGKLTEKDDREYADSVLQIAMMKNRDVFQQGKESENMCQAFWELYAPEIEADRRKSEERGIEIGQKRGMEIGQKCGERRTLISLIIKKIQRGQDILAIADVLEEPEDVVRPIYEAVMEAPNADVGQIYEKVYANCI